jgi:hypothetical protein
MPVLTALAVAIVLFLENESTLPCFLEGSVGYLCTSGLLKFAVIF